MSKSNKALFFREKGAHLLTQLGLSPTQARLYESLMERGNAGGTACLLSKSMDLPRSEIYRALSELQLKGLVEKEVSYPNRFNAIPIATGFQILLSHKVEQCTKLESKINTFLQKAQSFQEENIDEQQYKITIVEGKHRILNKISKQHKNVKQNVRILTTLPTWLQIIHYCIRDYEEALARGVEYRIVVENTAGKFTLPNEIELLLKKPKFKLVTSAVQLKTNGSIFDDKEVFINFFPTKSLSESPLIWSNHPSLVSMLEDQFEKNWGNSVKNSCV